MDFGAIFQLRTKRFWWMDVIFYFVISLLIATVFCYVIFLIKNNSQRQEIREKEISLKTVGTQEQKKQEEDVIVYQKKINDFTKILKNHEFASHAFAFMETQTMPNVWFKQFSFDQKAASVSLSGESDTLDSLSRQIVTFEKNEYVTNLGALNSTLSSSGKIDFSFNIVLSAKVFSFNSNVSLFKTESSSTPEAILPPIKEGFDQNGNPIANVVPQVPGANQKLITSFHLLLDPEVIGKIDQDKHTVTLNVPFGTDLSNITPFFVYSNGAKAEPDSNIAQNFSKPVIYKITAADGSTQDFAVTVSVLPKAAAQKQAEKSNTGIIIAVIFLVVIIIAGVVSFIVWKKMQKKKSNIDIYAN